jgi:predicted dithiol-disulfide oxidoreductase (DUF899 family)
VQPHRIVSRHEWLEARRRLLRKENDVARALAKLAEERRRLPWVRVEKRYELSAPQGPCSLADLFAGRSQLIVQHFMFAPDWQEGCVGCSFLADHVDAARLHFEHHDVSFAAVSRAPLAQLQAFKRRMGWRFCWVSSFGSDFNYDYHVSFTPEQVAQGRVDYNYDLRELENEELPGISVFHRAANGDVHHTYSAYGQGIELLLGAYNYLELTPKGRNETGPNFDLTDWVRHHDRYEQQPQACGCAGRLPPVDGNAG